MIAPGMWEARSEARNAATWPVPPKISRGRAPICVHLRQQVRRCNVADQICPFLGAVSSLGPVAEISPSALCGARTVGRSSSLFGGIRWAEEAVNFPHRSLRLIGKPATPEVLGPPLLHLARQTLVRWCRKSGQGVKLLPT